MPSVELAICGVPILVSANSARLVRLFADYFRYYDPQIHHSASSYRFLSGPEILRNPEDVARFFEE